MRTKIIFFSILMTIFTSCTTIKTTTNKVMDIYGAGVVQTPVIVDLEVKDTKVVGTASGVEGEEIVKQKAIEDAVNKSNADVLVEPRFKIENAGGRVTATVTAYPANYKNFRTVKPEEVPLFEVKIIQKAEVVKPQLPNNQPKPGAVLGGTLLGTLLIVALVVALL